MRLARVKLTALVFALEGTSTSTLVHQSFWQLQLCATTAETTTSTGTVSGSSSSALARVQEAERDHPMRVKHGSVRNCRVS